MKQVSSRVRKWRAAWVCLALALGLHVADEALTGFLPVYNRIVGELRAEHPWIPLPTFAFPVWLAGLVVGVLLLLALTPVVSRGGRWIRVVSFAISIVMIMNALGHLTLSLYWGQFAPGSASSPLLLLAAVALLVTAVRAKVRGVQDGA